MPISRALTLSLVLFALRIPTLAQDSAANQLEKFNEKFVEAHRHMDNAAVMSMWADDGVSLLPNTAPIVGKPAIHKFLDEVTSKIAGYKTISHDLEFRDIQVSGIWASEWAVTKQVVQPPENKPVLTVHGKMLLVLHRGIDGAWKIKAESWTPSPGN